MINIRGEKVSRFHRIFVFRGDLILRVSFKFPNRMFARMQRINLLNITAERVRISMGWWKIIEN